MQKLTYTWNIIDDEPIDFPDIIVNTIELEVPDEEKADYERLLPIIVPAVYAALLKNKYNKINKWKTVADDFHFGPFPMDKDEIK